MSQKGGLYKELGPKPVFFFLYKSPNKNVEVEVPIFKDKEPHFFSFLGRGVSSIMLVRIRYNGIAVYAQFVATVNCLMA